MLQLFPPQMYFIYFRIVSLGRLVQAWHQPICILWCWTYDNNISIYVHNL